MAGVGPVPLPFTGIEEGTFAWVAAIPPGTAVSIVLARAGFSQSLDLRTGRRSGTSPVALYRDPTNPYLEQNPGITQTFTATETAGAPIPVQVELETVALSFFPPQSVTETPPATEGYLIATLMTDVRRTIGGAPPPG